MNNKLILKIQNRINQYIKDYENKRLKKPVCCEICGANIEKLIWWSNYNREVTTLADIFNIPIKRLYCKSCGGTFALIPDFLKKYCRYGIDVMKFALKELVNKTFEWVCSKLCSEYEMENLSTVTLWLWKKKFSTSARLTACLIKT